MDLVGAARCGGHRNGAGPDGRRRRAWPGHWGTSTCAWSRTWRSVRGLWSPAPDERSARRGPAPARRRARRSGGGPCRRRPGRWWLSIGGQQRACRIPRDLARPRRSCKRCGPCRSWWVAGQQAAALSAPWNTQTTHLTDRMWPGPLTRHSAGPRRCALVPLDRGTASCGSPCRRCGPSGPWSDGVGPSRCSTSCVPTERHSCTPRKCRTGLIAAEDVAFIVDGPCRGPSPTVVDCTLSPPGCAMSARCPRATSRPHS